MPRDAATLPRETAASDEHRLELEIDLPGADPETVIAHFVEPELVTRWWAEESTVDIDEGTYSHRWPETGWTLGGRITEHRPGEFVAFTWQWDHEPDAPEMAVEVQAEPLDGGTRLTVRHGDYGPTQAGADEREGHREGWDHFLPLLAEALGTSQRA